MKKYKISIIIWNDSRCCNDYLIISKNVLSRNKLIKVIEGIQEGYNAHISQMEDEIFGFAGTYFSELYHEDKIEIICNCLNNIFDEEIEFKKYENEKDFIDTELII